MRTLTSTLAIIVAGGMLSVSYTLRAQEVLPRQEPAFKGKIGPSVAQSTPAWPEDVKAPKGAPNVLLVLLDDAGFAVSDAFGGPVNTPVIDELAKGGLRYNQFHTTAMCSPTRAALLTGRNHHQVGFGNLTDVPAGYPGYTTLWNKSTASIAEILKQNGYNTAAFGKWHNTAEWQTTPMGPFDRWPTGLGFEYFYGFMSAESSQWEPRLFRNTTPVDPPKTPAQGYHLDADLADDAIHWIHQHNAVSPQKPFFLYYAPGAVHAPHHVPKEWIEKYRGKFDQGWDAVRKESFARQKKMGIIPANAELTPRPKEIPAWDSLTPDEKKLAARQMEVFAAFMAHVDYQVGRVLASLKETGDAENTMVLYVVGDNGSSGEGGFKGSDHNYAAISSYSQPDPEKMIAHMEDLGSEKLDNHYATGWAYATTAPFQWMKRVGSHFGGTRNGLVVSWPGHIKTPGGIRSQFSHVNDIAPTIYEAAGITMPSEVNGVKQLPLEGSSLVYSLDNPNAPTHHTTQYFELFANRGIYKDGWFAGALNGAPFNGHVGNKDPADDRWELYDIGKDYSQAHDLAKKYPEKLKELQAAFDAEATRNNVYPIMPINSARGGRPSSIAGVKSFTYFGDVEGLTRGAVPPLEQSHRITAVLDIPSSGANGVIAARGGRYNGWTLFVKDGVLTYEVNALDESHEAVTAKEKMPTGHVTVAYEFTAEGPSASSARLLKGTGRLFINDRLVGEQPITRYGAAMIWSLNESFDVSKDTGTPVSKSYAAPFTFTGKVEKVMIDLK